jgi:hypothetical protein
MRAMDHFASWKDYQIFAHSVRTRNRYTRSSEEESFLKAVSSTAKERIITRPAGWEFFRAQRGSCEGTTEHWSGEDSTVSIADELPYPPERMKPRRGQASEGRVNPKGMPCLYGATSPQTAVAEVRPWNGELVSVGKFALSRSVKMIECLKYHDYDKYQGFLSATYHPVFSDTGEMIEYRPEEPSQEAVTRYVWTYIDQAFSEPVTRSDNYADYVPTQILAEVFKRDGYDGIFYRSRLSDRDLGINVAFFDLEVATITKRQICLFEVTNVKIESRRYEFRGIDPYSRKPRPV